MTDEMAAKSEAVVHAWLDILARGAVDEWETVTDAELSMEVAFMPGNTGPVIGRDANRAIVGEFWKAWKAFSFHDVAVHATRDPELVFATARSQAETAWGAPYANTYVFRTRLRDGKIVEHTEFFNALPVLEVFKDHLPA